MNSGLGAFLIFAVITGVVGFLAVQQGKIKRQIEENRRERERNDLAALGGIPPGTTTLPPEITPGPNAPVPPPDAGGHHGHHGGHDAGGHSGGGSDGGGFSGGDAGGGGHH